MYIYIKETVIGSDIITYQVIKKKKTVFEISKIEAVRISLIDSYFFFGIFTPYTLFTIINDPVHTFIQFINIPTHMILYDGHGD